MNAYTHECIHTLTFTRIAHAGTADRAACQHKQGRRLQELPSSQVAGMYVCAYIYGLTLECLAFDVEYIYVRIFTLESSEAQVNLSLCTHAVTHTCARTETHTY